MTNYVFGAPRLLADAGIPMIALTWPAMVALLAPVILIEGFLCRKWLKLSTWQALKSNAVSNLVSTIVGIPVAWAIMFAVEFGTIETLDLLDPNYVLRDSRSPIGDAVLFMLSSAWIGPPGRGYTWLVPAATLVLLIPFFFASYWIEYFVVRKMVGVPDGEPQTLAYPRVRVAVRNANLVTYGALFVGVSVWLAISLRRR